MCCLKLQENTPAVLDSSEVLSYGARARGAFKITNTTMQIRIDLERKYRNLVNAFSTVSMYSRTMLASVVRMHRRSRHLSP